MPSQSESVFRGYFGRSTAALLVRFTDILARSASEFDVNGAYTDYKDWRIQ